MIQSVYNTTPPASPFRTKGGGREVAGFSLIEIMFAMAIVSVSVLGLMALTLTTMRSNMQDEMKSGAVRLASQIAEVILAQPMEGVPAGTCGLATPVNQKTSQKTNTVPVATTIPIPTGVDTTYSSTNSCLGTNFSIYPNPSQAAQRGTVDYTILWVTRDLSPNLKEVVIDVYYPQPGASCLQGNDTGCGRHTVTLYKHRTI